MAQKTFQVIDGPLSVRDAPNGKRIGRYGTGEQFIADSVNTETIGHYVWLKHSDGGWSAYHSVDESRYFVQELESDLSKTMLAQSLSFLNYGNPADGTPPSNFFYAFLLNGIHYLREIQAQAKIDPTIDNMPLPDDKTWARQYVMGQAVRRLVEEWNRVEPIYQYLLNDMVTTETHTITTLINDIKDIASDVFHLPEATTIVVEFMPQFDTSFYLLRAPYYPDYALLAVPMHTMPFEDIKKIIIHEIASLVINPKGRPPLPTTVSQTSYHPDKLFPLLTDNTNYTMPDIPTADWNRYGKDNTEIRAAYQLPDGLNVPLDEEGGWKYFWTYWASQLFDTDIANRALPTKQNLVGRREYPLDWRIAHMQEFVEDACSTFLFGNDIYQTYVDVFKRAYKGRFTKPDFLHPAPQLRLEVTFQLLKLLQGTDTGSTLQDGTVDPITAYHDRMPGAYQIAKWIYDNQNRLLKEIDMDETRRRMGNVGNNLELSLDQQLINHIDNQPTPRFDSYEDADIQKFAYIDLNAGTGSPFIDLTPPPILFDGQSADPS